MTQYCRYCSLASLQDDDLIYCEARKEIRDKKMKINDRINHKLVCPMNWLQECLDRIQGASQEIQRGR